MATFNDDSDTPARVTRVFALFEVQSFRDLARSYMLHDKKLYAAGEWDPRKGHHFIHQVKGDLVEMDPAVLSIPAQDWRRDILCSWYDRAFRYVLWVAHGIQDDERTLLAHQYIGELECIQWFANRAENEDQSRLGYLWRFLLNGDIGEALALIEAFTDRQRKLVAAEMLFAYGSHQPSQARPFISPLIAV